MVKTNVNSLNKYLITTKILFLISPFLYLAYFYMLKADDISLFQAIKTNPVITIMFLNAMTNPFIAYVIGTIEERLKIGSIDYAILNLIFLVLAQILFRNIFFGIILTICLYKVIKLYNKSILETIKENLTNNIFSLTYGSILINILAFICFFASIKINF